MIVWVPLQPVSPQLCLSKGTPRQDSQLTDWGSDPGRPPILDHVFRDRFKKRGLDQVSLGMLK